MKLNRKQFCGAVGAGTVLLLLQACGGGGDDNTPAPGNAVSASIANNHGHALTIPAADLDSVVAKTYNIQGSAAHNHTVTLSAAQFATLKGGGMVTVTSSTAVGHDHVVTLA
jgi:hypothetical protein